MEEEEAEGVWKMYGKYTEGPRIIAFGASVLYFRFSDCWKKLPAGKEEQQGHLSVKCHRPEAQH